MNQIHQLIAEAQSAGLRFMIEGDRVWIRGATPPAETLTELRERKAELIKALALPDDLDAVCRCAVASYPQIDEGRLARFLKVGEDPQWCSERVARHLARRMQEGLIHR